MKKELIYVSTDLLNKQTKDDKWKGYDFESFNYLSADYSGKAGEEALNLFLQKTKKEGLHNWDIIYNGDCNLSPEDGTYDLIINGKSKNRIGIKTARIGKSGSFQHDNLHENECDFELFIDITPSEAYLSIITLNTYSMKHKHPIFQITPHLRKNTNNNYKLDLNEMRLLRGIDGKITICLSDKSDEEIINFISDFID